MNDRTEIPSRARRESPRCVFVKRRHGFTLVELIGTMILLGALFSMIVPMFAIIAHERRSTQQRQWALQHAANLLENSVARGWEELVPGDVTIPAASSDFVAALPGLERHLTVKELVGDPQSRQVTATIRWQNRSGQPTSSLTLSTWVFSSKEAH